MFRAAYGVTLVTLGVTLVPPKTPVAFQSELPTPKLPITPAGPLVASEGPHEGAAGHTDHTAPREWTSKTYLSRRQQDRPTESFAVELGDREVAGTSSKIPCHVHVAGRHILFSTAENVADGVAGNVALPRVGMSLGERLAGDPPAEVDVLGYWGAGVIVIGDARAPSAPFQNRLSVQKACLVGVPVSIGPEEHRVCIDCVGADQVAADVGLASTCVLI